MKFDHVGIRSFQKHDGEFYYAPNKVWITDSSAHPFSVEWLRYEEDSPVPEPVKSQPHVGFLVDDLESASRGMKPLLGPLVIDEHTTVAFYQSEDGAVVELKQVTG